MGCVCVSWITIWKMVIVHKKVFFFGKNLCNSIFFWSCHRVTHQILVTQEWRGFAEKTWTERRIKKRPGLRKKEKTWTEKSKRPGLVPKYFQLYLTPRKHKSRKNSLWQKLIYNLLKWLQIMMRNEDCWWNFSHLISSIIKLPSLSTIIPIEFLYS